MWVLCVAAGRERGRADQIAFKPEMWSQQSLELCAPCLWVVFAANSVCWKLYRTWRVWKVLLFCEVNQYFYRQLQPGTPRIRARANPRVDVT